MKKRVARIYPGTERKVRTGQWFDVVMEQEALAGKVWSAARK